MTAFVITKGGETQHVLSLDGYEDWEVVAELDRLPGKYERVEDGEIVEDLAPAWAELRAERDRRLAISDWTQLPDAPAGVAEVWQPYRQALRDLPENTADPRSPEWPEPPAE